MKTHEGANMMYSTGNPLVEFFSKAGSLFEKRDSFYGNEATALDLFKNAWSTDKVTAFKLLFWLRDVRGGSGNRSGFGSILNWVANLEPAWVSANLSLIPKYGRWKDLLFLADSPVEGKALKMWASAIKDGDGLACKWAPRENKANKAVAKKLRNSMGLSPKDYRKTLSKGTSVVETAMCNNNWNEVKYSQVPSVAMSRYGKAFKTHDADRFTNFLEKVADPESSEKVNAGALFPHDLMKNVKDGTSTMWYQSKYVQNDLADAQFEAMPNFFSTDQRVMPFVDTSGSMTCKVAGSTSAMDISISLGLYASDRLGKENPFYRKFIPFSTNAAIFDWSKSKGFCEGLMTLQKCPEYGYASATNINKAFEKILDIAKFMNVTPEQMPNTLLIVSDMQFASGVSGDTTECEKNLRAWEAAGYERPKVVYWNTAGYAGAPSDAFMPNTGLVSGFSPSILKAVFDGNDFTPVGIMMSAIEKYDISVPV